MPRPRRAAAPAPTPPPPLPFRLAPRTVTDAELDALNAAAGRTGHSAWIPTQEALALIATLQRAPRPETLMMLATHPDERVPLALRALPVYSASSRPWARVTAVLLQRALDAERAEGVAWTPLTATLLTPGGGVVSWRPTPDLEHGFLRPSQRTDAAARAADPFLRVVPQPGSLPDPLPWQQNLTSRLRHGVGAHPAADVLDALASDTSPFVATAIGPVVRWATAADVSRGLAVAPHAVLQWLSFAGHFSESASPTALPADELARALAPLVDMATGVAGAPSLADVVSALHRARLGTPGHEPLWRPLLERLADPATAPHFASHALWLLVNPPFELCADAAPLLARLVARASADSFNPLLVEWLMQSPAFSLDIALDLIERTRSQRLRELLAESPYATDPRISSRLVASRSARVLTGLVGSADAPVAATVLARAAERDADGTAGALAQRADDLAPHLEPRDLVPLLRSDSRDLRLVGGRMASRTRRRGGR